MTVRVRDEYHGCRSWVEIDRELPFEGTPVMADEEFVRAAAEIRDICGDDRARPRLTIRGPNDFVAAVRAARRALVLGIGGGGDVVGALAVARLCESLGTPFALGGCRLGAIRDRSASRTAPDGRDPRRPAAGRRRPCSPGPRPRRRRECRSPRRGWQPTSAPRRCWST